MGLTLAYQTFTPEIFQNRMSTIAVLEVLEYISNHASSGIEVLVLMQRIYMI